MRNLKENPERMEDEERQHYFKRNALRHVVRGSLRIS